MTRLGFRSRNSLINKSLTDLFDKRSLEHFKCDPASMTTAMATKMCLGEGLFISTNPTPSPPLAVSMVTAIHNARKIMKCWGWGRRGARELRALLRLELTSLCWTFYTRTLWSMWWHVWVCLTINKCTCYQPHNKLLSKGCHQALNWFICMFWFHKSIDNGQGNSTPMYVSAANWIKKKLKTL